MLGIITIFRFIIDIDLRLEELHLLFINLGLFKDNHMPGYLSSVRLCILCRFRTFLYDTLRCDICAVLLDC